jgi:hypothetical protein
MLFLAATIAAASPVVGEARPVGASAQARATIRILSGIELHFGRMQDGESYIVRDSLIRAADSAREPAKLIEFQ